MSVPPDRPQSELSKTHLVLALVFLVLFSLESAQKSSASDALIENIRRTVTALEKVHPIDPSDPLSEDVPGPARPLLTNLKHQLRDLILRSLNALRGQVPDDPAQLSDELIAVLKVNHIPVGEHEIPKSQYYGGIIDAKVERLRGHPELVAATVTLQIPCGDDTSLYLFEHHSDSWTLLMAVETKDYDQVNGAQGSFVYAVSPADKGRPWFLVTAHSYPWCTSCWNGVDYKILRPGTAPDKPKIVLSEDKGIYQCEGESYKLRTYPDGFKINYFGFMELDSGILLRVHADRYLITGDRATRIAPIAYSPQDFVDEWIALPWSEALRWTHADRGSASDLEHWHYILHMRDEENNDSAHFASDVDFVQPCSDSPTRWQIGVSIEFQKDTDRLPSRLYFTVVKKQGEYYLERIDSKRPAGCPGESHPGNVLSPKLPE